MLVWMVAAAALTGGGVALTLTTRRRGRRRSLTVRLRTAYRRRLRTLRRDLYRYLDWHLGTRTVATARRTRGGRGHVQVRTYTRAGQPVRGHRRTR